MTTFAICISEFLNCKDDNILDRLFELTEVNVLDCNNLDPDYNHFAFDDICGMVSNLRLTSKESLDYHKPCWLDIDYESFCRVLKDYDAN